MILVRPCFPLPLLIFVLTRPLPAGQLVYTDPETGVASVYNGGDIAWTLASTALVWLMVPGVGFFYSGLLRRKNALSLIYLSVAVIGVVSFQVHKIVTHPYSRSLMGVLTAVVLLGLLARVQRKCQWIYWRPQALWSHGRRRPAIHGFHAHSRVGLCYLPVHVRGHHVRFRSCGLISDLTCCHLSPVIAIGAIAERGRLGPTLVFVFIWSTIVYCPLACMTWNAKGWSYVKGGLDFAGGTPVHISSGTAALAISIYLKKRTGYGTEKLAYKPHNTTYVVLGTVFLWFGWFGFNGGSALSANLRAAQACVVTNLAASVGGITWMLWDYRLERKWSAVGFCSGAICGLVAITPASGFVGSRKWLLWIQGCDAHRFHTASALVFGFMAGTVCNFATQLKFALGYDDTLDIFATHGIGGVVGNVSTEVPESRDHCLIDVLQALDRPLCPIINCCLRRLHCYPRRLARSKLYPARLAVSGFGHGGVVLFRYDGEGSNEIDHGVTRG